MSSTLLGALLAVGAAVALNASYLMQHAGSATLRAVDLRRPLRTLAALLRSPLWALGALLGLGGWALHIAAMSQAPLSVVQAFVAGGLALAAPMAAFGLRRRLERSETQAIALMVIALVGLSIGLRAGRQAAFDPTALAAATGGLGGLAALLALRVRGAGRPLALGLAGGLLYGAADLALKAVTGVHGLGGALTSPWLAVGLGASIGAFFAFQRALQSSRPLAVIALMTAATNVSSILGAFAVYGDPLGRSPALRALHAAAFAVVIVAAWRLAPAQARLAEGGGHEPQAVSRPAPHLAG